jgi:mono/diheme cytochrome c family protein
MYKQIFELRQYDRDFYQTIFYRANYLFRWCMQGLKASLGAESGMNDAFKTILSISLFMVSMAAAGAPDGGSLFAAHCAACHGNTGGGGVGVPLSLSSFLNSVDDDFLRKTIRHGRPGRVMPAFSKLSDAQIDAIVRFIRSGLTSPLRNIPAPLFKVMPFMASPCTTVIVSHVMAKQGRVARVPV